MHRRNKMIFVVFLIITILCFSTVVFADDGGQNGETNSNFSLSGFETSKENPANVVAQNTMGAAISVIRIVGTGVAIIMLSYLGIKYMMAAPSEKADFKKSASIYVFGAILVFAATNIIGIIANFASDNIIAS